MVPRVRVEPTRPYGQRILSLLRGYSPQAMIRRWGWVTVVLIPDEKLIARALINAERDSKLLPSVSELAKAVGIKEPDVKRGLAMLERYEVVKKDSKAGGVGY